jgi:hypothetical protein
MRPQWSATTFAGCVDVPCQFVEAGLAESGGDKNSLSIGIRSTAKTFRRKHQVNTKTRGPANSVTN